jgi:hypothetical protein
VNTLTKYASEIYDCPKCGNRITVPQGVKIEDQKAIAAQWRDGRKIEAISLARGKQYLGGLAECNIVVSHISQAGNRRGTCGKILLETGITSCLSYHGLNLNW